MSTNFTCKLPPERAAIFREALGTDTVCIVSPMPGITNLPERGPSQVYMLDLETLDADQKTRLAGVLNELFDVPLDEIITLMERYGVPILAEGCVVTVSGQGAGLLMPDYDPDDDGYWSDDEDDDYNDDSEDWRYDPNRCPMCGDWLDAEGNCSDIECGWSVSDDEDIEPGEDEETETPPDNLSDIPF